MIGAAVLATLALVAALSASAPRLLAQPSSAAAADDASPAWLRWPAIAPDGRTIVFTWRGDLWRVDARGGDATPLTQHPAHDYAPVWSRDGQHIAFASDRHGNFDVYVMHADGGEPRRLTMHSADETPYSFLPGDSAVLFGAARADAAASRLYPTGSQPELYRVPLTGGRAIQVLGTPAEDAVTDTTGRVLYYHDRKGGENAWRKHHRSAIARDLWRVDLASGVHTPLTDDAGEDRSPVLSADGRTLHFLAERGGTFNVWRQPASGGSASQVTRFTGPPVRFLSGARDGTLAFGHDGALYTLAPGGEPVRVPVRIRADRKANTDEIITIDGGLREFVLAPNGKEFAFITRGDVFVAAIDGGAAKRVTGTPDVETGLAFSPDGTRLVYASERDGRWGIYEARRRRREEPYFHVATLIDERPLVVNDAQNTQPAFSPDGRELAYVENLRTLRVRTLADGATRTLLDEQSLWATTPSLHFAWSPDGRWITFDLQVPGSAPGEVGLVAADGSSGPRNLTRSGFDDGGARWVLGGEALLWLSNRDGLRSAAMTGGTQRDVYATFLTAGAWDRHRLSKAEYALLKDTAKTTAARDSAVRRDASRRDTTKPPVALELERIDDRRARLTLHSSTLGDAVLSADGETLYYLARFEKGYDLWQTNVRTRETKQLLALDAGSARLSWDREQKALFVLANGRLAKVDPANGKREAVAVRGEARIDNEAERRAQFDHVWRKVRDTYYTAGYHGVDWLALRPVYEKHLPGVSNGHEFAELLAEMLGELNVSHSGARFGTSRPEDDATAALGALLDPTWTAAGARIDEVLANGPLDRAGLDVPAGTIITAVDGEPLTPATDIASLLNRKAGTNVLLSLAHDGRSRDIVVKPITQGEEARLLYARWVRRNRAAVDSASDGRLGYVHIPGMNDGAYRTTIEDALGRFVDRDGLIVDVRFNSGGDLVADLAMFLSGEAFFDYTTDSRRFGYEPNFRWTKPVVSIANEAAYSDGHCYAYMVKQLGIGPLVGMPVPGTCTFAGWETLGDGLRWGVPGMGVKDRRTGAYLENRQTEPDVRAALDPARVVRGEDAQLAAAIAALRALTSGR